MKGQTKFRVAANVLTLAASTLIGIAIHEGFREDAYLPTKYDVPTIGFGTTKNVKMGDKITVERALVRLQEEIDDEYVAAIKKLVKVPLYPHEFGALVSFVYNVGVTNFRTSTLLKKLNAGDYLGACAELDNWVKQYTGKRDANGKKIYIVLPGLVKRRAEERAICEGRA